MQTRDENNEWKTDLLFGVSVFSIQEAIEFAEIAKNNGYETQMICNGIDCTELCTETVNDDNPQKKMQELFERIV